MGKKKSTIFFNRKHHSQRKDLAKENPFGDLIQAIMAILFIAAWIFDEFIFQFSLTYAKFIPWWGRLLIASPIFIIAGYFSFKGLNIVFWEQREELSVIHKSVFGIVRHPIYFGVLLVYLGFVVASSSIFLAILWLINFYIYNILANYEERQLIIRFKKEYLKYQQKVNKWIPKILKND